ncbi:SDR family oxidoreductase [Inquilinus sp.]|uniref:SDR family oxidoreductase n=1 Tax=Inquilinus sp. TaxID=1932117 RepID=UPI003784C0B7
MQIVDRVRLTALVPQQLDIELAAGTVTGGAARRPGQGLLRPRHRRRGAGQQRAARPGDDRPPPILSPALGTAAGVSAEEAMAANEADARYGEPEEIAELMAFLVSPGARSMTGSALRMDGGEVKSV